MPRPAHPGEPITREEIWLNSEDTDDQYLNNVFFYLLPYFIYLYVDCRYIIRELDILLINYSLLIHLESIHNKAYSALFHALISDRLISCQTRVSRDYR